MLNRIERRIMDYIFSRCRGKRTVLIDPQDILNSIAQPPKKRYEITKKQLEIHLKNLVLDGYIDFSISTGKDGKQLYVTTLTTQGEAFQRQRDEKFRKTWASLGWKIFLTIIACVVTSIFWWVSGK